MTRKLRTGEFVYIKWVDSYGVRSGWTDLEEYSPNLLVIESVGKVISQTKDVVAIAHNYADATENTPQQGNGIMVIPKKAILRAISFSSYLLSELKQKPQQS